VVFVKLELCREGWLLSIESILEALSDMAVIAGGEGSHPDFEDIRKVA
jgi:hypothetical protein